MMRVAVPVTLMGVASGQTLRNWELTTRDGQPVDEAMLSEPAHDDEMIAAVNSNPASTWVAGRNIIFEGATLAQAKVRMGTLENTDPSSLPYKAPVRMMDLPEDFDWRTEARGANCPSLKEIRDQANCGSCWAFGAVEAMTDRICIATNGADTTHLSAQDVTSCAKGGDADIGCGGGVPETVYTYYKKKGVVSGGNFGDKSMCYSYQLAPCAHHSVSTKYANCSDEVDAPECPEACTDDQTLTWAGDKRYGRNGGYSICNRVTDCPEAMRQDIYQNGPITGMLLVHQSFLSYKSGVYSGGDGWDRFLGGHAIKILGWGTEDGTPYWLVANSWNEDWGDEGFFKILRGSNLDQIENAVLNGGPVAGMPATALEELV